MGKLTQTTSSNGPCYSCGSRRTSIFYEIDGVPVNSCLLISSQQQALSFPRGDIRLAFCQDCGFIFNSAFDPNRLQYSQDYEETQGFSPRFREFVRDLAERLVERHDLRGKSILEIGCGKGEFLVLLCELGRNQGIGIDPAYVEGRLPAETTSGITFIQDFYSPAYAHLTADFVACRHTLEHVQPVREFVSLTRGAMRGRPGATVFFEVPDVLRVLREFAFWDIYYEHCSYFTLGSLARLFRACGLEVLDLSTAFGDQYLLLEARASESPPGSLLSAEEELEELALEVERFRSGFPEKLASWQQDLERIESRGQRAVLWGAGSKAVAYLTSVGHARAIEFLVDVNPFKQGKYIAGTGHEVRSPASLQSYKPDAVIVMNPIYCEEIRRDLEAMDLRPELIPL